MSSPAFTDSRKRRPALTLIELLVVMAIIAVLMSIMLPALISVRGTAQALVCSSDLKSIAMEFALFASADPMVDRGDSEALGPRQFMISDFQESLYGLDEFWDLGEAASGPLARQAEIMLCPSVRTRLEKRRGLPCSNAALGPVESVSLALNMRLYRPEIEFADNLVLAPALAARLRTSVLDHAYVPLVMDVDGVEAAARGLEPFYIAPPLQGQGDPLHAGSDEGPYARGHYWMPSGRHGGRTNVAFTGGHVLRSADPAAENWDWAFQASVE